VKTFCQTCSVIKGKKKIIVLDDIDLINEQSQQVFRNCIDKFSHNVNFISSSIKHDPSHTWYTKYNMKFGECFIFNTIGSPHTGFKYDNGSTKNRKSIELRIMLLKNVNPKEQAVAEPNISSALPGDQVLLKP
jgi:DNA polymerase III delta prime subunit